MRKWEPGLDASRQGLRNWRFKFRRQCSLAWELSVKPRLHCVLDWTIVDFGRDTCRKSIISSHRDARLNRRGRVPHGERESSTRREIIPNEERESSKRGERECTKRRERQREFVPHGER